MYRKLLIAVAILCVIAGGAIYYVMSSLDEMVAGVIETSGSAAVGTKVSVSGVSISLRDARASIRGLEIANPPGFSGSAISLSNITVALDAASLAKLDPLILTDVRVDDPAVNLVLRADGSSNLQALQAGMRRSSEKGPRNSTTENVDQAEESIRVRIQRLAIEGARLQADVSAVGGKDYRATLPAVRRNELGGAKGAPPNKIASIIIEALVEETVAAVARSEAEHQIGKLIDKELGTGDVGKAAKSVLNGILGK